MIYMCAKQMFRWWVILAFVCGSAIQAQPLSDEDQVIDILWEKDSFSSQLVYDTKLYSEYWDTLPQLKFWRKVINTSPEISYINIAATRQILDTVNSEKYSRLSYRGKEAFKNKLIRANGLPLGTRLYVTGGKGDYYEHEGVLPDIDKAVRVFQELEVDPWYAQAILLIESPGKLRRSKVGAYGPFQLMRYVAISNGLVVTRELDERADLVKSAGATAHFIDKVCLPETRKLLDAWRLEYDESSIWFRLMVLHVYHAGAGNVRGAMRLIAPKSGGMALIQRLWRTKYRRFGNASQNYSQLALASLLELGDIITMKGEMICWPPMILKKIELPKPPSLSTGVPNIPASSVGYEGLVFQP